MTDLPPFQTKRLFNKPLIRRINNPAMKRGLFQHRQQVQWFLKKWQLLKKHIFSFVHLVCFIQNKNGKQCCSVLNWQNRTQCRYIYTQRDSQEIQSHKLKLKYWRSHTYTHPVDKNGQWNVKRLFPSFICFINVYMGGIGGDHVQAVKQTTGRLTCTWFKTLKIRSNIDLWLIVLCKNEKEKVHGVL